MNAGTGYRERIATTLAALGIPAELPRRRRLPLCREAQRLAPLGIGTDGRDKLLTPAAARAWLAMQRRATNENVDLRLVSAFRSVEFQTALIRAKLDRGDTLDAILRVNAPPGYSEHHTGRAVDIGTADCAALDEAFENTPAFRWLQENAAQFGFRMSYPRDNAQGYLHEPWHWCYSGRTADPRR